MGKSEDVEASSLDFRTHQCGGLIMPIIAGDPGHPLIKGDAAYFRKNRCRRYRIRAFDPSEFGLPDEVALFDHGHNSDTAEANIVIVRRFASRRIRMPFYCHCESTLQDDLAIKAFLRLRGIDPNTMRPIPNSVTSRVMQ